MKKNFSFVGYYNQHDCKKNKEKVENAIEILIDYFYTNAKDVVDLK